ncbi:jg22424, partial [Pararge aegeria aegeria]
MIAFDLTCGTCLSLATRYLAVRILPYWTSRNSPAAKQPKPRPASYGHLHPEPRVDCEVLHSPELPQEHTLDVIFVHGLY